ncbi:putative ATP-dependent zinc protease [compost metagenome]
MPAKSPSAVLLAILLGATAPCAVAAQPAVWGWIEQASLMPENVRLKARLDTGVQTSVMDVRNIRRIRKNKQRWVQYDIQVRDAGTGRVIRLPFERPVERVLRVSGVGGSERRPVVSMDICLGNKVYREQFALRDREPADIGLLIGRRALEHIGAVDASKTMTVAPTCKP